VNIAERVDFWEIGQCLSAEGLGFVGSDSQGGSTAVTRDVWGSRRGAVVRESFPFAAFRWLGERGSLASRMAIGRRAYWPRSKTQEPEKTCVG
jgi:hypothetical protein